MQKHKQMKKVFILLHEEVKVQPFWTLYHHIICSFEVQTVICENAIQVSVSLHILRSSLENSNISIQLIYLCSTSNRESRTLLKHIPRNNRNRLHYRCLIPCELVFPSSQLFETLLNILTFSLCRHYVRTG